MSVLKVLVEWTREGTEYRTSIGDVECVVRTTKLHGLTVWASAIHWPNRPIEVATHDTHWEAQKHCVQEATR